jgi:ribosomal protein S18 acetylase RimI-like enzyme
MPVQQLRRLDHAVAQSLYSRLAREALNCTYSRRDLSLLERENPGLILEHEGNVLSALRHGNTATLVYGFTTKSDFADYFGPMFERLLPKVRKAYRPDTIRFRLTHGPARPVVEPVLRRLSFEPTRSWFEFSLDSAAKLPKLPTTSGITYREGGIADLDALTRLDREAFPESPTPSSSIKQALDSGERVLLALAKGEAVGCAIYRHDDDGYGYLHTLAVDEARRRKRIGTALTLRVAKAIFAEGADQLDLRTEDDNSGAIRLYTTLGFKHTTSGRDYERPADPKVIERMRRQSEGTFIKFGGWR